MAEALSFAKLDDILSKTIDNRGSIITKNQFSRVDEWIHSGNYLLNAQLSGSMFRGYPNSRSTALAGETGTGKTFLALNACREAQKMDYNVIFCDSEAAIDESTVKKFGIDPEKFRYQPMNTPRQFSHFVTNLIKSLNEYKAKKKQVPKILIVLDSLGNLATDKLKKDALDGSTKKDMTKQQEMKALFSLTTMDLAEAKIPFILTAHTYSSMNAMFPQQVMGGGCLFPGTKIRTPDGLRNVEDIKEGDLVETFYGPEEVLETHKEEKEPYEIFFDDDTSIVCSPNHRFFTGTSLDNIEHYTKAKRLQRGDIIKTQNGHHFGGVKVEKVGMFRVKKMTVLADVFDITVPSGNYILENGMISHNSGALYNSSIINFLHKAQLKEKLDTDKDKNKKEPEMQKTGIVVRSVTNKNRFARPVTIRFHISFFHGMNPFVGLESFIDFNNSGIQKGNMFPISHLGKLKDEDQKLVNENDWTWTNADGKKVFFFPKETARNYVVRHLDGTIPTAKLFSAKVFTKEVLEKLDENVIKPAFMLPDVGELNDDFENLLTEDNIKILDEMDENGPPEANLDNVLTFERNE